MKIACIVVLLLEGMVTFAQKQTFDLIRYTPPAGWEVEKSESIIKYTGSQTGTQDYCHWIIYKAVSASADGKTNFDAAWHELIANTLSVTNLPQMQPAVTDQGWQTHSGFATFSDNGFNTVALLITISGENQMQNLVMITNSQRFGIATQQFTESIDMIRPARTILETHEPTFRSEPSVNTTPESTRAEVWMNMQPTSTSVKAKFYTVYPNGDYYPHMPLEGLLHFSKATHNNDSWGKFTMQGSEGSFESKYETIAVKKISPTLMEKKGYALKFYKCTSVDGLTLEGAWSYIAGWSKDPSYSQPGCKPVIYFKKDGSFDDRGIFVTNTTMPNQYPERAPGTGTYEILNFTLILNYRDGRTVYKPFSGAADKNPAKDNEGLYIGTNPFYKK
ncbi:MAG: hypothetical protein E6Q41_02680 [Cyclobacteriaceae bacterium]|nr:MAG: hypothetical protein E6Q41_02680 [Cyclobacteriaceae bacterium]